MSNGPRAKRETAFEPSEAAEPEEREERCDVKDVRDCASSSLSKIVQNLSLVRQDREKIVLLDRLRAKNRPGQNFHISLQIYKSVSENSLQL